MSGARPGRLFGVHQNLLPAALLGWPRRTGRHITDFVSARATTRNSPVIALLRSWYSV
jgi:hypothetical protein